MNTLIRGTAALGFALAMASLGWSQYPQGVNPTPNQPQVAASQGNGNCGCGAQVDPGTTGKHGLLCRLGIHCHPLPYHPAESREHGGHGTGNGPGGAYGAGYGGNGPGFGGGNGLFGQYDHSPFPTSQPGTVVFPQSPYIRSPRDYFMAD
jgi:hypothetical protein